MKWIEANVLDVDFPPHAYDVWHDRAVFHFLTTDEERHAYVQQVLRAVKPGGLVIVATFAEDGPTRCSGLTVMRYSADELHGQFGDHFVLLRHEKECHHTPAGKEQQFFKGGMSLEDIAKLRSLAPSTIASHMERLILDGRAIDIDRLVDPGKRLKIQEFFLSVEGWNLNPVVEHFNGTVSYEDARLVRAHLHRNHDDARKRQ